MPLILIYLLLTVESEPFSQLTHFCNTLHILLFLLHLVLHKKEVHKANQCFLSVQSLVFQFTCYKTEVL